MLEMSCSASCPSGSDPARVAAWVSFPSRGADPPGAHLGRIESRVARGHESALNAMLDQFFAWESVLKTLREAKQG